MMSISPSTANHAFSSAALPSTSGKKSALEKTGEEGLCKRIGPSVNDITFSNVLANICHFSGEEEATSHQPLGFVLVTSQ